MNVNEPPNLTAEDKVIDDIARFLVLAARELYKQEKETGEDVLATLTKKDDTRKRTK